MIITVCFHLADTGTTDSDKYAGLPALGEWECIGVSWTPNSSGALGVDGTNYRTITVSQGATAIATITTNTGGTAFVAGTEIKPTLTGGLSKEFTGGTDVLKVATGHGGSGGAAAGNLVAFFKLKQAASY